MVHVGPGYRFEMTTSGTGDQTGELDAAQLFQQFFSSPGVLEVNVEGASVGAEGGENIQVS